MLQISQVKVRVKDEVKDLTPVITKILRVEQDRVLGYTISRRSIDARKKENILFVYNILVKVKGEKKILSKNIPNVTKHAFKQDKIDYSNMSFSSDKKIAVIGFGPAGMFSALTFAEAGVNVTVFERGEEVDKRIESINNFNTDRKLNTDSNIQFGEGGAGTFSDGKLTNRKKDPIGKWLFQELVKAGAPEEILYVHNPHIGTDRLITVVKNIRKSIIKQGSTVRFNSKVSDITVKNNGFELTIKGEQEYFDYVVLAIGHSSRDTIEMLYNNKFDITQKPFAVGFRIEQYRLDKLRLGSL